MSKWLRPGSSLVLMLLLLCLTVTPALAAPATQGATHVVAAGETLSAIATRYGVTVSAIASTNGLSSSNFIYVGQRLTIPGASGSTSSAGAHVVGYGESLTSIALHYGTTVWALAAANNLSNPNFVYSGQRLTIPGAGATNTTTPAATSSAGAHVVQAGQTLASIAARYGVTASAIASANGIVNSNLIYVGQKLTIPAGGSPAAAPQPAAAPSANIAGRWIDINLSTQSLVAYEGNTPVYWAVASTGLAGTPTVTGQYQVYSKYPAIAMSGPGYYLPDVPWTMFFFRGYAIHGAYWHNNFGVPMSHGCVNLSIPDAEWIYNFSSIGTPVVIHY
jgi:LysM repeat protein